jgi:MFS transporter, DHA1 family, inner membrane transport protein
VVLMMTATFSLITFVAPYLAETAGIGPDVLPLVLLGFGVVGALGTFGGGRLTDAAPSASLLGSCLISAVGFGTLWLAMTASVAVGMVAIAAIAAGVSVAALAAQNRILVGAFRAPELASTLMSSVFNVGIAAGAAGAAAALDAGLPLAHLPSIGLAATAMATALVVAALLTDK